MAPSTQPPTWKNPQLTRSLSRPGTTLVPRPSRRRYPLGTKVSDQQLVAVPIRRHQWHGEWNHSILPKAA
jgi:hypothetical protein